jgi:hypothetical protein
MAADEGEGLDLDAQAKQDALLRMDNMSFAEVIQQGHLALLKDLVASVNAGTASHQEKAILRNFLRDNGMTMGVPPQGTSAGDRTAPPPDLPTFGEPDYDN